MSSPVTHSTGFVGYLLPHDSPLCSKIRTLHETMGNDFRDWKSQPYPHTTLIYLGRAYEDDTKELLEDSYFREEISKFKGALCEFVRVDFLRNCLVFVYRFRDPRLADTLDSLTRRYERQYPTRFLHVTLGSVGSDEKKTFLRDRRDEVEALFRGTTFTIDSPTVIRVDHPAKSYHQHTDFIPSEPGTKS